MNYKSLSTAVAVLIWSAALAMPFRCYGDTAPAQEAEKQIVRRRLVIVGPDEFTLQDKHFTSVADLEEYLKTLAKLNTPIALLIVVSADQSKFGLTVLVLDACRKAGLSDIKIEGAPQQKNSNQPPLTAPSDLGSF